MYSKTHITSREVEGFIIFFFCIIFFCQIHPLVPFDADDWFYLSKCRFAVPEWGGYNPSRVFPEVLEPTCALLGTYIIEPITNNWVESQIIINGLIASVLITLYILLFERFLEVKLKCQRYVSVLLSMLFFVLHFLALRVLPYDNPFFFRSNDVAAFYVYVLSNILCASLVLYLATEDSFKTFFSNKTSFFSKGLLFFALYFALFSNVYASVMVASYSMVYIARSFFFRKTQRIQPSSIKSSDILLPIFILFIWLIALIFEINGGRSEQIGANESLIQNALLAVKSIFHVKFNTLFLLILLLPIITNLALKIFKKRRIIRKDKLEKAQTRVPKATNQEQGTLTALILCAAICLLFVIIVSAKAAPSYAARPDVFFSVFFFISIASFSTASELIRDRPSIALVLPLVLVLAITQCNTTQKTFKETNTDNLPPQVTIQITNDLVSQLQDAQINDNDEADIYVPLSKKTNNWPFPEYSGNTFAASAYKLGLTDRKIKVKLIPDEAMNKKYGIYLE